MKELESINQKVAELFAKLLVLVSSQLTVERFCRLDAQQGTIGNMMAPITAVLLLILGIVGAVKTDSFIVFAASLGVVVAFFVAHWCGRALMPNCDLAVANCSSRISSYGLFRTLALLAIVGFIAVLLFGMYTAVKLSTMDPLYLPLVYAAGILFIVWFLLNPTLVGIAEDSGSSPGSDALSIYLFSLTSGVRLHRVLFGDGLVVGNIAIAFSIIKIMRGELGNLIQSGLGLSAGIVIVFAAALAPFLLYVGFIFNYLVIDLLRSVLRIGK